MHPEASLTLVILAAGRARRYGRLKQLEPVGSHGAALLDYNLYDALQCGFDHCVLVVPFGLEERFVEHIRDQFHADLAVRCVAQPVDHVPTGRSKPWGTAHAVLAAAEYLSTPFAVINGDDVYGRSAFASVARHLRRHPTEGCLAAYRLAATLSIHGGVSRGICTVDPAGHLTSLTEATEVRQTGGAIHGLGPDGTPLTLAEDAPTSMNLWGFPLPTLEHLRGQWRSFLSNHGSSIHAEFLLSTAVHDLVQAGALRLRVLPTNAEWLGLTFPADTDAVRARIAHQVASGQYPEHLEHGLS
jgi:choline kinase